MIHKCLGCRGLQNAGLLDARFRWEWRAATIGGEAAYHLVRLKHAIRRIPGGGTVWLAETACGLETSEEVHDE